MPLDRDAVRARFDAWADPPADPGDLDDTEIDALWKSANDVPRLLAEVERQGCVIQDLKVSESRAKALSVKQEIELRLAREAKRAAETVLGDWHTYMNADGLGLDEDDTYDYVVRAIGVLRDKVAAWDQETSHG